MTTSKKVTPPNSVVLVADPSDGEVPSSMNGSLFSSTESCVAVGCRSEIDGETEFTLGATRDVDPGRQPDFEAELKTPTRRLAVRSVLGQILLEAQTPNQKTKVSVWVNDTQEPDNVIIGVV